MGNRDAVLLIAYCQLPIDYAYCQLPIQYSERFYSFHTGRYLEAFGIQNRFYHII